MNHIKIRPIKEADYQGLFTLVQNNKKHFIRYFPIACANTQTIELAKKYVDNLVVRAANKTMYAHGIFSKSILIGIILIRDIDWEIPKGEIAYSLDKEYQGKGIMTHATKLTISHCFEELKMHKLFLRASPINLASVRIAEKCGFQREGLLREDFKIETGELVDHIYFGLLKRDLD